MRPACTFHVCAVATFRKEAISKSCAAPERSSPPSSTVNVWLEMETGTPTSVTVTACTVKLVPRSVEAAEARLSNTTTSPLVGMLLSSQFRPTVQYWSCRFIH